MKTSEIPDNSSMGLEKHIDRRKFCVNCISCATGMVLLSYPGLLSETLASKDSNANTVPLPDKKEMRKLFMQKGSCAHLFFYLLNREYGHNKEDEERAIDQLAGGIAERGYQCGMLWGSSMGAAAEAYRKHKNKDQAIASTIFTTQQIIDAFVKITNSPDCRVITNIDLTKRFSKLKMIFSAGDCFDLANKWAPKAIKTTKKYLSQNSTLPINAISCASEVVKKMGGSDEEMVMVSGFAGGLGLSGNGCGALSAAIWMKTLNWCRKKPEKRGYAYDGVEDIMTIFEEATQGKMLCSEISGKQFSSIDDHTEFIKNGGCKRIINLLAETRTTVE